jgi:hypothetical protein
MMIQLDDVKQLLSQTGDQTLTLYLTVDPAARENQAATPAWRIWLKDALKGIEDGLNGDGAWPDIRERVESYFADYQPNSKSLALFAGPDFQQVYELPVAVENQATFGAMPVAPLLWVMDEYQNYLIVMVDQQRAFFYTAYLGEIGFQQDMKLELDTDDWREKTGAPPSTSVSSLGRGSSQDDYEDRVEENVRRFYRQVGEQIADFVTRQGIKRVVLGGSEQSAYAVRDLLPEHLAKAVVDVLPIPMRCNVKEIMERVQPRALDYERETETALVEEVIGLAKAGGRGALGREAVMQALDMQRVEVLVAPWPVADSDSFKEIPARVFASGGSVELVHGEAAERLQAEGGLAARLYYAL